jgi:type I restriction enzyme S subunit
VRHTAPKRIYSVKVRIPDVSQQQAIAEYVSPYDDLIENNRRRISFLEDAARMLYREWFLRLHFPGYEHVEVADGLPIGWERRTLSDVITLVKDTVKPSSFGEDDIHIGLEHLPRRSFTLSDWEPTNDLTSSKTRFQTGDILFSKIRPYFHKVGFTVRSGLASSDALVFRVKESQDWPLVVCATSSDHFVAVASKTVREGSKMPRADWNVLKKYPIPKASQGVIEAFNDIVKPITDQCKTLALENRSLVEARDILLPRLMNGEIAV